MDNAKRRVVGIAEHVNPRGSSTRAGDAADGFSRDTYARADPNTLSSYERVHGNVSRDPVRWELASLLVDERTGATIDLRDVIYEKSSEGMARITINRPEKRNAFTPRTIKEIGRASCRERV